MIAATSLADRLLAHADASSINAAQQRDPAWCVKAHELLREAAKDIAGLERQLAMAERSMRTRVEERDLAYRDRDAAIERSRQASAREAAARTEFRG